jgi:hypothetical protein
MGMSRILFDPRARGLILAAASLLCTSPPVFGQGGVPDPIFVVIGTGVNLGARFGDEVDPRVTKTVSIRDNFNKPVQGATVVIAFANCTSRDLRVAIDQPHHPGMFNCAQKTFTAITDADGIAVFRIAGGAASGPGSPPGAGSPGCATVRADGILLGNLLVGAYDNDLTNGVNPADLSNWLSDRNAFVNNPAAYRSRSDFDGSATVTPADGSAILSASSSPASNVSCGPTCL